MGLIKKGSVVEGGDIEFSKPSEGLPTYPQDKYPGHPVDYPTCSAPVGENKGCDAWKRCNTQGEGPYTVVYENLRKGGRSSCHCRLWHYRLKAKPDRYMAIDDPWIDKVESVAIDPQDIKKGTRVRRYSMFNKNVRLPMPNAPIHQLEDYASDLEDADSLSISAEKFEVDKPMAKSSMKEDLSKLDLIGDVEDETKARKKK